MLTQGPAPDPKCKLIMSSFLTLPHLLDCLICTRNVMSIVLLLQMMEDGIGDSWVIYFRRWEGEQGGYHLIVCCFFFLYLCILLSYILNPFI